MNWLAHILLSEPTPAFRVGNVLADILSITELRQLPEPFQAGIVRHRAIDSFTDKHSIFKQSVARLDPKFRRFGGVLMDVFYDHLLTARWNSYSNVSLESFVANFHNDVDSVRHEIPADSYAIFQRMRSDGWLTSYGDIAGVRLTLKRMSRRLRRPIDLAAGTDELARHYDALTNDFDEFFPLIRLHFDRVDTAIAAH